MHNLALTNWYIVFSSDLDLEEFDRKVADLSNLLSTSINIFPGPKHPLSKYYYAWKNGL